MKSFFYFALVLIVSVQTAKAGWVDDWLQQHSGSMPNSFSGQQRGYYSGGSFSARWPSTTEYPVTVEMPRIKSGCGGIDVFMGGFSFMNTDYLVNKLQAILSGAPAVAFDLALKTLCEQCSNTIKNFEAMADKLNSMQLDECAASKELVGIVADANGFHSSEVMREKLGTAIKENKLVSGAAELWDSLTKQDRANNNQPRPADVADVTSGCNADITNIFLAGGSLLGNVGSKMGIPSNHIDLIRGLVGDVQLEGPANGYRISTIPPCPQNNPDDIKAFTEGAVYSKSTSGACNQINDANRDLITSIGTTLNSIADKMENKGTLTTAEQTFLESNPLATLPILKTAVGTSTRAAVIPGLADITAKAYSLQMLSDLYLRGESIAAKAREVLEKKAGPSTGQGPEKCAAVLFAEHAGQGITAMLARMRTLKEAAKTSYVTAANEMNSTIAYLNHMQRMEAQMVSEITRRYGKDLAARMQL
ncbi:MAG: conjugal transfer protein TraH [Desulfobulbus sp.]|nr:conjugal transfer protein TraH [Desulfobulbus sp.]